MCFDHHNHFSLYTALMECPSLDGVHAKADALELIAGLPAGRPNLVTGWHSDRFLLERRDLEGMPPVAVLNFCLHGYVMNPDAAAMAAAAGFPVEPATPLDAERLMPGVLEYFGSHVARHPGAADRFVSEMRAAGLYGVEDMLYVPGGEWPCDAGFKVLGWATPAGVEARGWAGDACPSPAAGFRGIKLFTDGAVGARTAAIGAGYIGHGEAVLTYRDDELLEAICRGLETPVGEGLLAVHAIGDLAVGQVLRAVALAAAMPGMPADAGRRVRIEHAQFITPAQAKMAHEMGITLSMQPNFSSDSTVYLDRLDPATAAANNPFRMLIDEAGFVPGVDLLFGSDGMPHGIAAALKDALFPPHHSQYLAFDELMAGYSADPARGFIEIDV